MHTIAEKTLVNWLIVPRVPNGAQGQALECVQTGQVTYAGTAFFTYAGTAFSAMTLHKIEFR